MPFPFPSLKRWPFGSGKGKSGEKPGTGKDYANSTSSQEPSYWVIQDGGVRRWSPSEEQHSRPNPLSPRCDDDDNSNADPCPPPNTPTEALTTLFRNMEFYRLGPDSLSTFFPPGTRGQDSVLSYMRSEIEALRELLREREREAGIAASAPQLTGTRATLKWLENPGPQTVAELITARDAAENKLKESKRKSWLWGSPTTPTPSGFSPNLPRASGERAYSVTSETPGKFNNGFGRRSDEASTGESFNACNIGRPRPPPAHVLRALLELAEAELQEQEEREEGKRLDFERTCGMGPWYTEADWSASLPPIATSQSFSSVQDIVRGEEPVGSREEGEDFEDFEDQDFYDNIYEVELPSYQVAEEARFHRARVVDLSDEDLTSVSPVSSDGSSVYGNEDEDDDEGGEFWRSPESPVGPVIERPEIETADTRSGSDEYEEPFYLHKDKQGGQRLVKRLLLRPPYYYPYYTSDGEARIGEIRSLLSCPPHSTASEVILTLLRYKPETRAFMARKVPGVARRANQINWGGVMEDMKKAEDQLLFFQWEESEEPLFQLREEDDSLEMEETNGAPMMSAARRYLVWKKPGKSKLSEADSCEEE